MVVILGHRRQRNFERIFFFLCLALTCFCGSSLLALNAQLFYAKPAEGLMRFAWIFVCLGLYCIPPLVLHLHVEYASLRHLLKSWQKKRLWLAAAWLPAVALSIGFLQVVFHTTKFDFERPTHLFGLAFEVWLILAFLASAAWQIRFRAVAVVGEEKAFHRTLAAMMFLLSLLFAALFLRQRMFGPQAGDILSAALMIVSLVPLVLLIGNVERFNFLQIGRQRNLIYAVFTVFVALLYLSLVRRAGQWLEPLFPPEATAALLLFLPVVFFEPLQRVIRRLLRQTAQSEVDRAQKLMGPITEAARSGDIEKLRLFSEGWIAEQFQLAEVCLSLASSVGPAPAEAGRSNALESFDIRRDGQRLGTLAVRSHGAMISGETFAALEFVCEQLPAAFDLCRLIEEKLQLERELAQRERLALVGQMAASISHNLKNPLGSIKTILQVQMESPELPASVRQETQMVLDEINRLSSKLNQLLQFSRPGVRSRGLAERCDVSRVAENVVGVLRHEAEQRGVTLDLKTASQPLEVAAGADLINDTLSNLLLNALEAVSSGGHVSLSLSASDGQCCVSVEDDGAGIPPALREKILQPFFTTKARGTGLGLAIVARRAEEIGGALTWESPIANGRGTRFHLSVPLLRVAESMRQLR